jgi:hypothetical protein
MQNLNRRGVTIVELVMALVLVGLISIPLYGMLQATQRTYRQQTQRVGLNANIRSGITMLPGEIRELDAGDPAGSDIVAMTPTSLTYKAMRNVFFLCDDANVGGLELIAYRDLTFGLRAPATPIDSVLVFADFDPKTRFDDTWLHGNLASQNTGGAGCPDGAPSIRFNVTGIPAAGLAGVMQGAPLRTFEVVEIRLYQDGGAWWLGGRRFEKASAAWSATEPFVGPLTGAGLQLAYYDATGAVTADRARVARLGVTVTGRTAEPIGTSAGTRTYAVDSLLTQVALRNNPRF